MDSQPIPFEIHPSSGVPIYRQLVDQVYALLSGGKLVAGDLLPSVRRVARAASVNPMTVSKAYSLLEVQGVVERVRGQGMRVAKPQAASNTREKKEQFHELLKPALHRAQQLGLSDTEVREVLDALLHQHAPVSAVGHDGPSETNSPQANP